MSFRRRFSDKNRRRFRGFRDEKNVSDADGVDAIKDANAMLGNRNHFDPEGEQYAREMGWIKEDDDE